MWDHCIWKYKKTLTVHFHYRVLWSLFRLIWHAKLPADHRHPSAVSASSATSPRWRPPPPGGASVCLRCLPPGNRAPYSTLADQEPAGSGIYKVYIKMQEFIWWHVISTLVPLLKKDERSYIPQVTIILHQAKYHTSPSVLRRLFPIQKINPSI